MTKIKHDCLKRYFDTMQDCNFGIIMTSLDAITEQEKAVLSMSREIYELLRVMHRQVDIAQIVEK